MAAEGPLLALRKTSLIDFPGRLSSVLFLPGCDFRCPYCQNAPLVLEGEGAEGLLPLEEALALLERRRGLVSGLVVSGGEPLLRPELPGLLSRLRGLGYALKLDTNGSRPEALGALLADPAASPDYLALDFKTLPRLYARVAPAGPRAGEALLKSLALLRASGLPYEIRLTCAPGILGPAEAAELGDYLLPEEEVVLQAFRPGGCLDPAWDARPETGSAELEALLGLLRPRLPRARIRGASASG